MKREDASVLTAYGLLFMGEKFKCVRPLFLISKMHCRRTALAAHHLRKAARNA